MNFNDICDYDDGLLFKKGSDHIYGYLDENGYIQAHINRKTYRVHRIIWEMLKGPIPENYMIDHIDGNRANNRIENLRLATPMQNTANSTGFGVLPKGVKAHRKKFQARINHKGVYQHLGTYDTVEEAKKAYDTKAQELHGEFARTENLQLDPQLLTVL